MQLTPSTTKRHIAMRAYFQFGHVKSTSRWTDPLLAAASSSAIAAIYQQMHASLVADTFTNSSDTTLAVTAIRSNVVRLDLWCRVNT